jgi:subtilase family serine protease
VVDGARGTPDISMSGACNGAVDYYYTFANTSNGPWHTVCGTSESSPLFAGIVAIADQIAGKRLGWLNPELYLLGGLQKFGLSGGIKDVTIGDNHNTFFDVNHNLVTVPGFNAAPGYDMASGWGSIDANRFCRALAGTGGVSENSQEAKDATRAG